MRALCLLRESLAYRRDAFVSGIEAAGYKIVSALLQPNIDDVVVMWNRTGGNEQIAKTFERAGARVIVAENGHLGKSFRGGIWYAMALGHHAGAGTWPDGGPDRWDGWNVPLAPWRDGGSEVVIFAQRGIGETGLRSPPDWADHARERLWRRRPEVSARVRAHPGAGVAPVSLSDDLSAAWAAVTWHSAAACGALTMGVPVYYACTSWIGAQAGSPIDDLYSGVPPKRDDADRLAMFRRMAWAMWELEEISRGDPFHHLLGEPA